MQRICPKGYLSFILALSVSLVYFAFARQVDAEGVFSRTTFPGFMRAPFRSFVPDEQRFAAPAGAPTLTTVYNFPISNVNDDGGLPNAGLLQGRDGDFYGTSVYGGYAGDGTVFKITPTGTIRTLVEFYGPNGSFPIGNIIQGSDGNFYGTTESGGMYGIGTVFEISLSGIFTTIYSFSGNDGYLPVAGLIQGVDGSFYGTTVYGGPRFLGNVFKLTPPPSPGAPWSETSVYTFGTSPTDGADPEASLVQGSDGNFYGTTYAGGAGGEGTVFKLTPSGTLTTLHSFSNLSSAYPFTNMDGANSISSLVQGHDGTIYGAAYSGGEYGFGLIFEISLNSAFKVLHTFSGLIGAGFNTDGANPVSIIRGDDGNLYGTTNLGGTSGHGTVFGFTSKGILKTLVSFTGESGPAPGDAPDAIIQAKDGNFYAATYLGGESGNGGVFELTSAGKFKSLYSFSEFNTEGATPNGLSLGSDGNLYGTSQYGGVHGAGTVFRATPAGSLWTLYDFDASFSDGGNPEAPLIHGLGGNFYGTAAFDGDTDHGTAFKVTPNGMFTTLAEFNGTNGAGSNSALFEASDGIFYGTSGSGGAFGNGAIFKISPTGVITTLHSFSAMDVNGENADGTDPLDPLIEGRDGNFYGTSSAGGASGNGTIFRITSAGVFTTIYNFSALDSNFLNADGAGPNGALIQGRDGSFYGTASSAGAFGGGTVFKLTPSATPASNWKFTTLYSFGGVATDGYSPLSGLSEAPDGSFYGTTTYGGSAGVGTIYRITSAGAFITLIDFNQTNGQVPSSALTLGPGGVFYGTTPYGGAFGNGTIFEFAPLNVALPTVTISIVASSSNSITLNARLVSGDGTPLTYAWSVSPAANPGFTSATTGSASSSEVLSNMLDANTAGAYIVTIKVTDSYGQTASASTTAVLE